MNIKIFIIYLQKKLTPLVMKKIYFLINLFSLLNLHSQITNDECSGAITIPTGTQDTPILVSVDLTGATTTSIPETNCSSSRGDLWYKTTVPTSGSIAIRTSGASSVDTVLEVYSGSCGSLNYLACNDDSNNAFSNIKLNNRAPFEVIYIRVWEFGVTSSTNSFKLDTYEPCEAPLVFSQIFYSVGDIANTLTADGINLTWYTTATGGQGSLSAPTPNTAIAGLTSYWVTQTVNGCVSPRAKIDVTVITNPSNDNCQTAAIIAVGTNTLSNPLTADFSGATDSPDSPTPSCGGYSGGDLWYTFNVPASGKVIIETFADNFNYDSAFTVYSGSCSSDMGSLVEIGCDDDNGDSTFSKIALTRTPNETIRVRVWNFADSRNTNKFKIAVFDPCSSAPVISNVTYFVGDVASQLSAIGNDLLWYTEATGGIASITAPTPSTLSAGTFSYWVAQSGVNCESPRAKIDVIVQNRPINDNCNGAISVVVKEQILESFQQVNLSLSSASPNSPTPLCASYIGSDLWYKVEVPSSGNVTIATSPLTSTSDFDTGLEVYSGTCNALNPIACDDDNGFERFSEVVITGRVSGEVLFARTWEYGNSQSAANFLISAYDQSILSSSNFKFSELSIYPNPFKERFSISINEAVNLSILDLYGNKIFDKDMQSGISDINISSYSPGLYFVKISNNKGSQLIKMVKE
jgi:Secretion system C-terminal sorting domain/Ig-like domain CHU_C associated